jgi:S1-C subfamily serine protease
MVGDSIVSIAGRPVDYMSELTAIVRTYGPGKVVLVELRRGSRSIQREVRLSSAPAEAAT